MGGFAYLMPVLDPTGQADPRTSAVLQVLSDHAGPFDVSIWPAALPAQHVSSFTTTKFGVRTIFSTFIAFAGLAVDTVYRLDLRASNSGSIVDRAVVRTWPSDIGGSAQPFKLFLGSCFSTKTRTETGNNVHGLRKSLSSDLTVPHLKLFCGDQVYLDIPVLENLPAKMPAMEEFVLDKYLANWGAIDEDTSGFGGLLRAGTSLFMSDDHEFWNNYPNAAIYAPSLFSLGGGKARSEAFAKCAKKALTLFQQVPPTMRSFSIGASSNRLTLITLDGRFARTDRNAHRPEDVDKVIALMRKAPGPVLLVLSQPLFDLPHRNPVRRFWAEHIADLGIADFDDYRHLVAAIAGCPHDVCVLSGDIHGGRICSVRSRHLQQTVWEVVSSPLSLVLQPTRSFGGKIPRGKYPDIDATSLDYGTITGSMKSVEENHGVSLAISRRDGGVEILATYLQSNTGAQLKPQAFPIKLRSSS